MVFGRSLKCLYILYYYYMFGIDTMAWTKLFMLYDLDIGKPLTLLLSETQFFITKDVEKELYHYYPSKEKKWGSGAIFPRLSRSFQKYISKGFDEADASLLEYAEDPEHIIITEDGEMLAENVTKRNNIIHLIDMVKIYHEERLLSKREFREVLVWFRKKKNITKRKYEKFLERM